MSSSYYENLIKQVIDKSFCKNWKEAVLEWEIIDCFEDESLQSSCICGKENIKYLFTIKNTINKNLLYPIGSSCIKKFERNELNDIITIKEGMFELFHAIQNNIYITLSTDFFSRKLLEYLYTQGVFQGNTFNNFCGKNDYEFLLKMFNKRNKNSITEAQKKKIKAIIVNSIRPYLIDVLNDKIKT